MTLSRLRSNNDNALFPSDLYHCIPPFCKGTPPRTNLAKARTENGGGSTKRAGSTGYALPARYTFLAMPGRDKTTGNRSARSATAFGHLRKQGETDGLASVLITPTASPGCGKLRNPGFGNGTQKNRSPVPRAPQKHRNRNKEKAIPPPGLPFRRKSRHTLPHTDVRGPPILTVFAHESRTAYPDRHPPATISTRKSWRDASRRDFELQSHPETTSRENGNAFSATWTPVRRDETDDLSSRCPPRPRPYLRTGTRRSHAGRTPNRRFSIPGPDRSRSSGFCGLPANRKDRESGINAPSVLPRNEKSGMPSARRPEHAG